MFANMHTGWIGFDASEVEYSNCHLISNKVVIKQNAAANARHPKNIKQINAKKYLTILVCLYTEKYF